MKRTSAADRKERGVRPDRLSQRRIAERKVSEIMTREVVTVRKEDSVKKLYELFKEYDFNAFPVVDEDQELIGIVTKLDFMRVFSMGLRFSLSRYTRLFATDIEDIMREALVKVRHTDPIKIALEYMVEFGLRSIPVVDGKRLVGIVSRGDVMEQLIMENDSDG